MTTKKLIAFIFAVIAVGLVIFQFTQSKSNPQNQNSREPSRDTSASSVTESNLAPLPTPHGASQGSQPVTAEDLNKLSILKQILDTKNDNDPRLDTEFTSLSENAKKLMREEYKSLAAEKFNEKGTVIFLLGRNLKSKEDFDFLSGVLSEPPCYNMADCSAPKPPPPTGEAAHEESINQVTLAYPQIVTLKALDTLIDKEATNAKQAESKDPKSIEMSLWTKQTLEVGAKSPVPEVSHMAHEISHKISP